MFWREGRAYGAYVVIQSDSILEPARLLFPFVDPTTIRFGNFPSPRNLAG